MTQPTPPAPFSQADIDNRFDYHPPATPNQRDCHQYVRTQAKTFAQALVDAVPRGRELASALTALEEALMWANAGIARHDDEGNRR